jgi:hypothetical protein
MVHFTGTDDLDVVENPHLHFFNEAMFVDMLTYFGWDKYYRYDNTKVVDVQVGIPTLISGKTGGGLTEYFTVGTKKIFYEILSDEKKLMRIPKIEEAYRKRKSCSQYTRMTGKVSWLPRIDNTQWTGDLVLLDVRHNLPSQYHLIFSNPNNTSICAKGVHGANAQLFTYWVQPLQEASLRSIPECHVVAMTAYEVKHE